MYTVAIARGFGHDTIDSMHKYFTPAIIAAFLLTPLFASAQTAEELNAQAQALLQQIAQLQQQMNALQGGGGTTGATPINPTPPSSPTSPAVVRAGTEGVDSSTCPQIGRVLKMGISGDDVRRLQQYLARDPALYPEATVSGYYGGLTQAAVQRWQTKYNIVGSGTPASTGYGVVGPRTAAAIALLCTTGAGPSAPTGGTGQVGGFMQISPISGEAPLTVSAQVNVNTTKSCTGAIYTLNWGDGSQSLSIPVPANNCQQLTQTYTHIYPYGGTWPITLAAGAHKTNATVTVYGASAPTSPNGGTIPNTNTNSGLPPETFLATPVSGSAPLSVTFSGVVTSNDQGWCQGGCTDALIFGDGAGTSISLPANPNSKQNYNVTHSYSAPGTYTATLYQGQVAAGRPPVGTATIQVTTQPSYGPFNLTPGVGGDPQKITVSFAVNSSCAGYDVDWGDGSVHQTQTDGGATCGAVATTKSFTHQYGATGSFTITLKRGPSLGSTDTASVVIQ